MLRYWWKMYAHRCKKEHYCLYPTHKNGVRVVQTPKPHITMKLSRESMESHPLLYS